MAVDVRSEKLFELVDRNAQLEKLAVELAKISAQIRSTTK